MVGRLNTRGIFDPRFTRSIAVVGEGAFTCSVLVRRPVRATSSAHNFDTGVRGLANPFQPLWSGPARVQPNKDWRARGYEFASETTVFQAVRFQLPLVDGEWESGLDQSQMEFRDEDQVLITATAFPEVEMIKRFVYVVRNPTVSGNAGLQNLLCDVDFKGGVSVGNP